MSVESTSCVYLRYFETSFIDRWEESIVSNEIQRTNAEVTHEEIAKYSQQILEKFYQKFPLISTTIFPTTFINHRGNKSPNKIFIYTRLQQVFYTFPPTFPCRLCAFKEENKPRKKCFQWSQFRKPSKNTREYCSLRIVQGSWWSWKPFTLAAFMVKIKIYIQYCYLIILHECGITWWFFLEN